MSLVQFIKVKTNQEKIEIISHTLKSHFLDGKKVGILTPNLEVSKYIDELLWKNPPDSFLPHEIAPTEEPIAISSNLQELDHSQIVLNLSLKALNHPFEKIIELYDLTHPERKKSPKKKNLPTKKEL